MMKPWRRIHEQETLRLRGRERQHPVLSIRCIILSAQLNLMKAMKWRGRCCMKLLYKKTIILQFSRFNSFVKTFLSMPVEVQLVLAVVRLLDKKDLIWVTVCRTYTITIPQKDPLNFHLTFEFMLTFFNTTKSTKLKVRWGIFYP